ncbi:MAG TPA: MerR family transcriptional regulator [Croceibacterium sp.]
MLAAREVSRLAGFKKPWMLNHLEREDIFVPDHPRERHHGIHRRYTFRDLVVLRAINRLLELGARPKRIKTAIANFAKSCPEIIGDVSLQGQQLKFAQESGHFLVTSSEVLYCPLEKVIDLLHGGQMAFSFMIDSQAATLPSLRAAAEVIALPPHKRRSAHAIERIATSHAV